MHRLDCIPRLGWASEPSPVEELVELSTGQSSGGVWVKRDDALGPLHGSTKTRKLDYLLAAEPWASAPRWASVGAIGSGHLTGLVAAARALGTPVDAYVFFEPVSRGVEDNLAYTATGAATLTYAGGPVRLLARHPALVVPPVSRPARTFRGAAVIPMGATVPQANVGLVRAGLELGAQVASGDLPEPSRVYVPLGSGGTSVGLAVGLAFAGLSTEVHAVDVVGRAVANRGRLRRIRRGLLRWMRSCGVALPDDFAPSLPVIRRDQLGGGYGVPSAAGVAAVDMLRREGIPAEDVYSGKAFACLLDDLPSIADRPVLFWMTARADDPLLTAPPSARDRAPAEAESDVPRTKPVEPGPAAPPGPWGASAVDGWREALPAALRRRLERDPTGRLAVRRRRFLQLGSGALLVGGGLRRGCGYELAAAWRGNVLSEREAVIIAAAAAALVPDAAGEPLADGPTWSEVAANVDRFLVGAPAPMLREIHGMLAFVEQGSGLGGALPRLSRLKPASARRALETMASRGSLAAQAVRGLRDLCMLGAWQDPRRWPAIGFDGPTIAAQSWELSRGRDGRPRPPSRYDHLLAPPGSTPEAGS